MSAKAAENSGGSPQADRMGKGANLPSGKAKPTQGLYPATELGRGRVLGGSAPALVLFDQSHRGDVWRLEIATHCGRTFGNWRKWYHDGVELKPTRQGATIPLERIAELHAALGAYLAGEPPPCR